ncbi:hypothetical protein [Treponema saccharophilum]|uniref:hypothetical protein n=1 Tax=Treponema saccharophilum TaxID=165 RepID=UPI001146CB15|nr:hypothetical protein [Treponema saccharophilum]
MEKAEVAFLCFLREKKLQNVRMPFPWENIPRFCLNCGYRGYGKNNTIFFFFIGSAIKCPKCGKKKFIKDPSIMF